VPFTDHSPTREPQQACYSPLLFAARRSTLQILFDIDPLNFLTDNQPITEAILLCHSLKQDTADFKIIDCDFPVCIFGHHDRNQLHRVFIAIILESGVQAIR
jgi:hypothetical protein